MAAGDLIRNVNRVGEHVTGEEPGVDDLVSEPALIQLRGIPEPGEGGITQRRPTNDTEAEGRPTAPASPAATRAILAELDRAITGIVSARAALGVLATSGSAASSLSQPAGWGRLCARERQVAHRLAAGESDREVAHALGISVATTKSHVRAVLAALSLRSRWEVRHVLRPSFEDDS